MKRVRIYLSLAVAVVAASCQNQELLDRNEGWEPGNDVTVRINWAAGLPVPERDGMRLNLFNADPEGEHYGKVDVAHHGGKVRLLPGSSHHILAYNYAGNTLRFRNESDPQLIEATSGAMVRATYSRNFPDEPTVGSIGGDMHLDVHNDCQVSDGSGEQIVDMYPLDIVKTYTYEVRGVTGTAFIRSARGGVSGFSASYYLSSGTLSETPSTILFDTTIDAVQNKLTGTFRTFGPVADAENHFTIEILYPSQTPGGGIVQHTWDVTEQLSDGDTHIVIEDAGIEIPDEGGDSAGGWDVDLGEWNDVTVQL